MTKGTPHLRLVSSSDATHIRGGAILPHDIRPEVWDAFEEMRKKIRKPLTGYAKKLIINKLLSMGGNPNDILEQSIMNAWQGVFPLRPVDGGNGSCDLPIKKSPNLCRFDGCNKLGIIGQGGKMYCRKHDPEAITT